MKTFSSLDLYQKFSHSSLPSQEGHDKLKFLGHLDRVTYLQNILEGQKYHCPKNRLINQTGCVQVEDTIKQCYRMFPAREGIFKQGLYNITIKVTRKEKENFFLGLKRSNKERVVVFQSCRMLTIRKLRLSKYEQTRIHQSRCFSLTTLRTEKLLFGQHFV